ncbi:MAG: DUF262 domain-containing protein [Clostridia bacterium]|nr:DUF262 domain-containing protein [Clostridia bacterium]
MEELNLEKKVEDIEIEIEENILESSEISIQSLEKTIVIPMDLSVEMITSWYKSGKLSLDPAFQRRYVWNDILKSAFIESLILNVPIPALMFANDTEKNKFIVIDGKQRLNAIISFIAPDKDGKGFRLRGLQVLTELNGYTYKKLLSDISKAKYLNRIENAIIKASILKNYNSDVLYFIFNRLNGGGVPLSPHELRQSLFAGEFINFINEYSESSTGIKRVLNLKKPDKRMRDAELLVRYYAFKYYGDEYTGNINEFFNMTCDRLNKEWAKKQEQILSDAKEFESAVEFIYSHFEEYAFRAFFVKDNEEYFGPFNRPMFDLLTSIFSDSTKRQYVQDNNIDLKSFIIGLFKSNEKFAEAFLPTTHSKEKNYTRITEFTQALFK